MVSQYVFIETECSTIDFKSFVVLVAQKIARKIGRLEMFSVIPWHIANVFDSSENGNYAGV